MCAYVQMQHICRDGGELPLLKLYNSRQLLRTFYEYWRVQWPFQDRAPKHACSSHAHHTHTQCIFGCRRMFDGHTRGLPFEFLRIGDATLSPSTAANILPFTFPRLSPFQRDIKLLRPHGIAWLTFSAGRPARAADAQSLASGQHLASPPNSLAAYA